MRTTPTGLLLGLALALTGSLARSHGLDANRVEMVLRGEALEVVATPPASFLRAADRDGDGLLSRDEVGAQREAIQRALIAAMHITDGAGHAAALERADVSVPRSADGHRGGEFLRITTRWRWPTAPGAVRVRFDFVREHPVTVYATHARALRDGRVALVGAPELAILRGGRESATLLRALGGGAR